MLLIITNRLKYAKDMTNIQVARVEIVIKYTEVCVHSIYL